MGATAGKADGVLRRVAEGGIIKDLGWQSQRKVAVKSPAAEENIRCSKVVGQSSRLELPCMRDSPRQSGHGRTNGKRVVAETPVPSVCFIALFVFALPSEIAGERRVSK
jgi:hypothetical protein